MNSAVLSGLVLAIVGGAGVAHAVEPVPAEPIAVEKTATDCTYRAEPVAVDAPIKKSTLTVLAQNPAKGGDVRRDTLVAIDVEYRIKDFGSGTFVILPLFKTVGDGWYAPDNMSEFPVLPAAAGKAHLCVALNEMYEVTTLDWPISFALNLMHKQSDGSMMGIESAPTVKFNAVDIPAEALARQAERPPVEYFDSLRKVWMYFETRVVRYKACNQKFPAGQPALTKAYRAWESRHADAIQLASELQFDYYLLSSNGKTAQATQMFDAMREGGLNAYVQLPIEVLKQQCDWALSEYSDSEDLGDNAISDQLEYLRKWQKSRKKALAP